MGQSAARPRRPSRSRCLLDFIGVALAGAREPLAEILNADATELGGHPQAGLIGRGRRGNVEQAALINGAAGHAHDYDDVHMAMSGHPTVPVAPAVLALAEHHQHGAKDLLAAFAAGVDTECIIGRYLGACITPTVARDRNAGQLRRRRRRSEPVRPRRRNNRACARHRGHAGGRLEVAVRHHVQTAARRARGRNVGVQAARLAARGFTSRDRYSRSDAGICRNTRTAARRRSGSIAH